MRREADTGCSWRSPDRGARRLSGRDGRMAASTDRVHRQRRHPDSRTRRRRARRHRGDTGARPRLRLSAGMRSATPGPTRTPHPAATTAATPATTSSTATSSTSRTYRSSDAPPRLRRGCCTIPIPTQTSPSPAARRPARQCRSTTSCRWRWRGIWVPGTGPTTCGCDSPTTPPICMAVAGEANQDKGDSEPATWMPPNTAFWCQYAVQFIAVLRGYALPIDAPSAAALRDAASNMPGRAEPISIVKGCRGLRWVSRPRKVSSAVISIEGPWSHSRQSPEFQCLAGWFRGGGEPESRCVHSATPTLLTCLLGGRHGKLA